MELQDRYLQAVRFWLPQEQQDDIIAELSEDRFRTQSGADLCGVGPQST